MKQINKNVFLTALLVFCSKIFSSQDIASKDIGVDARSEFMTVYNELQKKQKNCELHRLTNIKYWRYGINDDVCSSTKDDLSRIRGCFFLSSEGHILPAICVYPRDNVTLDQLTLTNLKKLSLPNGNLKKSRFIAVSLDESDLRESDFRKARLSNVSMKKANVSRSTFAGTVFSNVNCDDADFEGIKGMEDSNTFFYKTHFEKVRNMPFDQKCAAHYKGALVSWGLSEYFKRCPNQDLLSKVEQK